MKYLFLSTLLLLSVTSAAAEYEQCLSYAKKGYDRCMQRFGRFGQISGGVCEDPYIQNVMKCKSSTGDAEIYESCVAVCVASLKRCIAHQARFNNTAVCDDAHEICIDGCNKK